MPPKKKKSGKKDTIDRAEIEREYGFSYRFFKSVPELADLLDQAIKEDWTPAYFEAKFRATKWFKQHSDIYRQNYALKYSDPKTYQERLGNIKTQIQNLAGRFSVPLNKNELNRLAERAYMLGWNEDQILDKIANQVRPSQSGYGGDLAAVEQQLAKTALANGVRVGPDQLNKWMRSVVRGEASVRQYEQYIRDVAAKTFTAFGEQIKAGMDMADIASPYIQSMSELLELNPNQVTLFDTTLRKALSYRNEKGEAVPMSITDFEEQLRKDKRWQYTKNARDTYKEMAVSLAKSWGLA